MKSVVNKVGSLIGEKVIGFKLVELIETDMLVALSEAAAALISTLTGCPVAIFGKLNS